MDDSYIVRIYRRSSDPGKEVAGLVERAGGAERKAFASAQELWAFLCGNFTRPVTKPMRKWRTGEKPP